MELILKVIAEKGIKSDKIEFIFSPTYRSLLIQLVFRNDSETVVNYLELWYNNKSIVGDLFASSVDLAALYQNCIFDELCTKNQRENFAVQLDFTAKISAQLVTKKELVEKIMKKKKMEKATYEIVYLKFLAELKFCMSNLNLNNSKIFQ